MRNGGFIDVLLLNMILDRSWRVVIKWCGLSVLCLRFKFEKCSYFWNHNIKSLTISIEFIYYIFLNLIHSSKRLHLFLKISNLISVFRKRISRKTDSLMVIKWSINFVLFLKNWRIRTSIHLSNTLWSLAVLLI